MYTMYKLIAFPLFPFLFSLLFTLVTAKEEAEHPLVSSITSRRYTTTNRTTKKKSKKKMKKKPKQQGSCDANEGYECAVIDTIDNVMIGSSELGSFYANGLLVSSKNASSEAFGSVTFTFPGDSTVSLHVHEDGMIMGQAGTTIVTLGPEEGEGTLNGKDMSPSELSLVSSIDAFEIPDQELFVDISQTFENFVLVSEIFIAIDALKQRDSWGDISIPLSGSCGWWSFAGHLAALTGLCGSAFALVIICVGTFDPFSCIAGIPAAGGSCIQAFQTLQCSCYNNGCAP